MKTARIWVLLLLAVLLPIRGAAAAAMLCPVAHGSGMGQPAVVHGDHHAMGYGHASPPSHSDAGHQHAVADKCNSCSTYCSLTPLPGTAPVLAEPPGLAAVECSDHAAAPPSFVSGGQDRPPRRC